jgi:hypothetical protein
MIIAPKTAEAMAHGQVCMAVHAPEIVGIMAARQSPAWDYHTVIAYPASLKTVRACRPLGGKNCADLGRRHRKHGLFERGVEACAFFATIEQEIVFRLLADETQHRQQAGH